VKLRSELLEGDVSTQQWVGIVCQAIKNVLGCTSWRRAFAQDGLMFSQAQLRSKIVKLLGWDGSEGVPATRPSLEQLQSIFPKRTKVQSLCLFEPHKAKTQAQAKPKAKAKVKAAMLAGPISSCTRSKTKHL
jgi:hypothetical protein